MGWFLLVVTIGFASTSVSDVKIIQMTEAQCKAALIEMQPLKDHVGLACIGPNGEVESF